MLNNNSIGQLQSKRVYSFSNVDFLLKISLGLMLLTVMSFVLVYAETASIDIDGNSYDVEYDITGTTLTMIDADLDFASLIVTVDTVSGSTGTLDVTFDRSFFDSVSNGVDEDFLVLIDNVLADFTEIETTPQSRTLSIELPLGTENIEIIGTVIDVSTIVSEETPEPVEETPEPVEETPEPVEETPEPVEETPEPVEETPEPVVDTTPKTQCGPGTILQDGVCVLDERCGPGTILQDGVCVLESTSSQSPVSSKGLGKELVIGIIAAFVVAGIIGIILGLMSKASKSKD